MEKKKGNAKLAALGIVVLCAAFAIFAEAYAILGPKPIEGGKNIKVEIITVEAADKTVEIKTDAEFLRQALEQENLIQGDESEFGLFVKTVDGVTADDSKQEWWCITKNGEQLMTGVDFTPIADGEHYEITLTAGY